MLVWLWPQGLQLQQARLPVWPWLSGLQLWPECLQLQQACLLVWLWPEGLQLQQACLPAWKCSRRACLCGCGLRACNCSRHACLQGCGLRARETAKNLPVWLWLSGGSQLQQRDLPVWPKQIHGRPSCPRDHPRSSQLQACLPGAWLLGGTAVGLRLSGGLQLQAAGLLGLWSWLSGGSQLQARLLGVVVAFGELATAGRLAGTVAVAFGRLATPGRLAWAVVVACGELATAGRLAWAVVVAFGELATAGRLACTSVDVNDSVLARFGSRTERDSRLKPHLAHLAACI